MKYDKGSPIDKLLTNFPVRYIFWEILGWLVLVGLLIYWGITV